jgi:uncharacterized protein DUF5667
MMDFEKALETSLQVLREGRADVESCLAQHPEHADALRPLLLAASKLMSTYATAQPSDDFAAAARERFRVATGERIAEAFEMEPSPSFFAAARIRFLMAAQKMRRAEAASRVSRPRRVPVFGSAYRALAGAAAALVLFAGVSGYTVASASDALPGDTLYGVKLQTERVRLALAFTEDAEQDVRIDIATERVEEIEQLTEKGRIIGPGVIDRLKDDTEPLADDIDKLDPGELARVYALTEKSKIVLEDASGQVAAEAQPLLAETKEIVESAALESGVRLINNDGDRFGALITPQIALETQEPTDTPEPTPTPETSPTSETPPEPTATVPPARDGLQIDPTPVGIDRGVTWIRLSTGLFSTLIPSPQDGWNVNGLNLTDGSSPAPKLIRLSNANGTQIITINPKNGDTYWFVAINGVFDEVQLRITRDGQTFVADRDLVTRLYGPLADVPLYVIDNIEFAPEPAPPSPEPTAAAIQ